MSVTLSPDSKKQGRRAKGRPDRQIYGTGNIACKRSYPQSTYSVSVGIFASSFDSKVRNFVCLNNNRDSSLVYYFYLRRCNFFD